MQMTQGVLPLEGKQSDVISKYENKMEQLK